MKSFSYTVDLDRDVNVAVPGRIEAGSLDRGSGNSPRFSSSLAGMNALVRMLDGLHVPATFFCEGRTLEVFGDRASSLCGYELGVHGYDHEDLSGCSVDDACERILRTSELIRDISGTCPKSFRSPYMSRPAELGRIMERCGLRVDSSEYAPLDGCMPNMRSEGYVEISVLKHVADGRTSTSYLWPMHEGKRSLESYLELADRLPDGSVLVIADHSWHIAESRSGGRRTESGSVHEIELVEHLITGLLDRGYVPHRLDDFIGLPY